MSFNISNLTLEQPESLFNSPIEQLPLLNVTRGLPSSELMVVLFGYLAPIFFVVTVLANIMIVVVLSRPDMRTPTNLVLLSMAVADLLTLVFPIPWYFYLYTLGYYKQYLYPASLCNAYTYMTERLPAFLHTASIWCTLLLAIQRYVYICHPGRAKIWCTNKRVMKMIGAIFLLAFGHQLIRFFESTFTNISLAVNISSDTISSPVIVNACLLNMSNWTMQVQDLYYASYFLFRLVFVNIGPCLALIIFNVLLYRALKRAEATRSKLFMKSHSSKCGPGSSPLLKNGKSRSHSFCASSDHVTSDPNVSRRSICIEARKATRGLGSGRDANSTTVMLIVVVTVFLFVEIPLALATSVHVIENIFDLELVPDRILNLTIIFTNFAIVVSYPLNFAIYCGMSRAFRETFQQIFIRRFVENSSSPWTSNKCTSNSTLGANRERKHSVNSASEKSKQLPDNQRADLESIRRTVCPSFLDERINGGHFDAPECSPKVAITNRNGLTQLATTADLANKPVHALANELFETML